MLWTRSAGITSRQTGYSQSLTCAQMCSSTLAAAPYSWSAWSAIQSRQHVRFSMSTTYTRDTPLPGAATGHLADASNKFMGEFGVHRRHYCVSVGRDRDRVKDDASQIKAQVMVQQTASHLRHPPSSPSLCCRRHHRRHHLLGQRRPPQASPT